jgi:hypothetical protein
MPCKASRSITSTLGSAAALGSSAIALPTSAMDSWNSGPFAARSGRAAGFRRRTRSPRRAAAWARSAGAEAAGAQHQLEGLVAQRALYSCSIGSKIGSASRMYFCTRWPTS